MESKSMEEFCSKLKKIELHAHLTGSIRVQTLHDIWLSHKRHDPNLTLEDPMTAMPPGKVDYDLKTFFPLFSSYIYTLITTVADIRQTTLAVLEDFEADNVIYLELRTTPRASNPQTSYDNTKGVSKELYVSTVLDAIEEYEKDKNHKMKTNLILSIDRRNTLAEAEEVVSLAMKYKHRSIVALDLCGDPAKTPINHLTPAFLDAKKKGLKLTLHFAEFPSSSTDQELRTLLSWGPDRLGHVIHVSEEVREEILRRKIGVELCLSCNVFAGMLTFGREGCGCGGFADHHFGWWWLNRNRAGVALCTDDVGVFGSPLSNEYRLAAEHFNLSEGDLIDLCRGIVGTTFADDETKQSLREIYLT